MALTLWSDRRSESGRKRRAEGESDLLSSASNVLFLCVGMTAVMILVNDNLARAFATAAAVALVRFRIKFTGKFLRVSLLYAVVVGMACGLNRPYVAWTVTAIFVGLVAALTRMRGAAHPAAEPVKVPSEAAPPDELNRKKSA